MRIMLVLLALLLVPAGVNAEVTTVTQNDLVVTWYPVQEGITHFAYNISVQNLQDTNRDIDLSTLFSDTSFDISQLKNVKFYEWKNVSSSISVPTYENQSYDYTYVDNATGKELTKTRWRMVQTGTAAETVHSIQWKPSKMQSFEKTASVYKERMGVMNVPKYASKEKDGTGNGTKWFRLEFDAPIQKLANGWGSSGKVALEIDGYEYHPWWGTNSWNKRRPILFSGTTSANYTMNLTFDSTGLDFRDNGSDVRIVSSESGTEIDLDRVNTTNFNTSATTIWFRFNESGNVTSDNINSTYYLYYGNPSAGAAPANRSEVYLLYDDFEDGSINDSIWETEVYYGGSISESGGELIQSGDSNHHGAGAETIYQFSKNDTFEIKYKHRIPSTYSSGDSSAVYLHSTSAPRDGTYGSPSGTEVSTLWYVGITTFPQRSYKIIVNGPSGTYSRYLWNSDTSTWDAEVTDAEMNNWVTIPNSFVIEFFRGHFGTHPGYWDDIIIRKYLSPEPTTSLGDEEYRRIQLSNPQFSPADGKMGSNFVFIVNVTGSENISATLRVFDPSQVEIFNSTVNMTNIIELRNGSAQASISVQLNETGSYSYYWHANSTEFPNEKSNATDVLSGPMVYSENHNETFEVPSGATKILAGAYWYGTAEDSLITLSLRDPDNITHTEFSIPTIVKNFKTAIIDLPLISYNVTVYSGYKELVYSNTSVNGTWTFTLVYTDVTKVETEIGWS